jgi:hypothetical protein
MDPLTIGLGVAGLGMKLFGANQSFGASKEVYAAQQQQIALEQRQEALRRQAMELDARRKTMEEFRAAQRARSLALTNAAGKGAQFGSGLAGGYGQISGQSGVNLLGIAQNLGLGRENFGLSAMISQSRIAESRAKSSLATGQGWSSLGGDILGAIPAARALGKGGWNSGSQEV